jgi:hypothetical protein
MIVQLEICAELLSACFIGNQRVFIEKYALAGAD